MSKTNSKIVVRNDNIIFNSANSTIWGDNKYKFK